MPHHSLDGLGQLKHVSLKKSISHPGNAEYGNHRLHACREDGTLRCLHAVGASQQQDEGGGREHHDFDNGGHAESHRLAVYHEGRTQTVERTKEHDKNSGKDKDKHGQDGMPFIVYILYLHLLDIKIAFGQPLSVLRVVCQLLAHLHGEQGAHKYPDNGSRNRYFQNIEQGDIKSRQQPKQCDGGSRNGTCRNSLLRSNHRNAQWPLGTNLGLRGNLGNHGKHRICHMSRAGNKSKQIGHNRAQDGDLRRILPQQPFCQLYHIIQSASRLHAGCGRNDGGYHQHNVNGR